MPGGFVLVLGGVRSGKSALAQRMAEEQGSPVCVVATAEPVDDDMADRIGRHRAGRPPHWATIEEPLDLVGAVAAAGSDFVVLDCVTVWLGNAMHHGWGRAEALGAADALASALRSRGARAVVVSNEVGLGVHPATPMGRDYRDLLGEVNSLLAGRADRTLFMAAGRAVELRPPGDLLREVLGA